MKTATDEIAAILALTEPWFYAPIYGQPSREPVTTRIPAGPYSFDGIVMPETAKVMAPATGKEVRAHLLDRAEAALAALDDAGWQLTSYPRMEFTGEVDRFVQTITGELVQPSRQGGISLRMRFEVDRPR